MPLNLKLHHSNSLPRHLQINIIIILTLDSFPGLFVSLGKSYSLLSFNPFCLLLTPGLCFQSFVEYIKYDNTPQIRSLR